MKYCVAILVKVCTHHRRLDSCNELLCWFMRCLHCTSLVLFYGVFCFQNTKVGVRWHTGLWTGLTHLTTATRIRLGWPVHAFQVAVSMMMALPNDAFLRPFIKWPRDCTAGSGKLPQARQPIFRERWPPSPAAWAQNKMVDLSTQLSSDVLKGGGLVGTGKQWIAV